MKLFKSLILSILILTLMFGSVFAEAKNGNIVSGDLSEPSDESAEVITMKYLKNLTTSNDFKIKKKYLAGEENVVRVDQYFNGTRVIGADLAIVIDKKGVVVSRSGNMYPDLKEAKRDFNKKINKHQAADAVTKHFKDEDVDITNVELVLRANAKTYEYTYEVVVLALGFKSYNVYVDAATGSIIDKIERSMMGKGGKKPPTDDGSGDGGTGGTGNTPDPNSATVGTGTDILGQTRSLNTYFDGSSYLLVDTTRGAEIRTYDAYNQQVTGNLWSDADNIFNADYDAAAVSSHYNFGLTYDYYLNIHGRNSFDNKGAAIVSTVHFDRRYNNAFWTSDYQQFVFGDGDGRTFIELSGALDVIAHEFQHAVTENTADLIYQNESGAVNESMSDIFGAAVEWHMDFENFDWTIGEDIVGRSFAYSALRSMSDPASYGDPDSYETRYTGTEDYGGVHINAGIVNKAAYLFATSVNVPGKSGVEVMEEVFYEALTKYMTSSTGFSGTKDACQAAVSSLGYDQSVYNAITAAFTAVGIQ